MSPDELAKALAQPGRASIAYLDRYNPDRPLVLECFRPRAHNPDKPVVTDVTVASAPVPLPLQAGRHRAAWCEPQRRGILRGMDPGS